MDGNREVGRADGDVMCLGEDIPPPVVSFSTVAADCSRWEDSVQSFCSRLVNIISFHSFNNNNDNNSTSLDRARAYADYSRCTFSLTVKPEQIPQGVPLSIKSYIFAAVCFYVEQKQTHLSLLWD